MSWGTELDADAAAAVCEAFRLGLAHHLGLDTAEAAVGTTPGSPQSPPFADPGAVARSTRADGPSAPAPASTPEGQRQ
ncbi:hypothetical protein ACPYPG_24790 [Streptomyces sp. FR-108]|uniref:hypothetical protein n=1 Tax=Streptomyces sp. FR-108 TaxID=3416665 RepID=UPI003CFB69EB